MRVRNEGIYKITCKENDKVYIGRSIDIDKRLKAHRCSLRSGKHINKKLQSDFNKYGENSFTFEVERYTDKPLDTYFYESYYAEKYDVFNVGYNIGRLSKSKSIKKIVDNLDHYVKKFTEITDAIPKNEHRIITLGINGNLERFFKLDGYDIRIMIGIIKTYVGVREGLSVDVYQDAVCFTQVDMQNIPWPVVGII